MKQIQYRVAGHLFRLLTDHPEPVVSLLPSYEPFADEQGGGQPVFSLSVAGDSLFPPGPEVYRFEWDGARYTIYRGESGYGIGILPPGADEPCLLCAGAEFNEAAVHLRGDRKHDRFVLNNCLMMMYAFSTAAMDTLLVHASVTAYAGKGYLFLGKSGTGKSTHSRLWLDHIEGTELLNDDNPVLRVTDGQVIVSGSPWSGKTPCYKNLELPAGALVRLNQAPENKIVRCRPSRSFAELLASCSNMTWDRRIFDGVSDTVTKVAERIPCYALECLPDKSAALLCVQTVAHE